MIRDPIDRAAHDIITGVLFERITLLRSALLRANDAIHHNTCEGRPIHSAECLVSRSALEEDQRKI